jgi:hypothetical protein
MLEKRLLRERPRASAGLIQAIAPSAAKRAAPAPSRRQLAFALALTLALAAALAAVGGVS